MRIAAITSDTVSPSKSLRAGQHLPQHHAEGPDIGPAVDLLTPRLFGAHVGRSSENHALERRVLGEGRRERRADVSALRLPRLGEPEVEHLDRAVVGDLDVGRFEIAVDDALLVRRLEGFGDLQRDRDRFLDRDRPALIRSERSSPSTSSIARKVTSDAPASEVSFEF